MLQQLSNNLCKLALYLSPLGYVGAFVSGVSSPYSKLHTAITHVITALEQQVLTYCNGSELTGDSTIPVCSHMSDCNDCSVRCAVGTRHPQTTVHASHKTLCMCTHVSASLALFVPGHLCCRYTHSEVQCRTAGPLHCWWSHFLWHVLLKGKVALVFISLPFEEPIESP